MTIGATDRVHYDPAAARSAGHAGVVAPPNLLAAIVEWGIGTPEAGLQPDGTPDNGDTPLGDGDLGLRVMGAGEEMQLVNPVTAGTEVASGRSGGSRPSPTACGSRSTRRPRWPTPPGLPRPRATA
jgi:hypothetical protein